MQAEAEQYSYNMFKNCMILSLNILINNILIKKSAPAPLSGLAALYFKIFCFNLPVFASLQS